MVIVQLISAKTGEPIKGKRVSVGNNDLLSLGVTDRQATNNRGEVEFPKIKPCNSGTIYIDGNSVYKGKIEGFQRIYL
ncbi:MAG: hypothetical protein HC849_07065 [Oscillatoriales cyanobacterium RU_3_3]|nr:hypothetical protein [Microcoleus sp. SU_5_6]NJL67837.1 hypothetical protein [Microcoleus sp. SM1_3_4]NJM59992.1 hypothetical protein [Oscillatoriales cyanobacterium RU_3_3]NJR20994.1 hypothetical protein [Richelia sp. CSU_2_1]